MFIPAYTFYQLQGILRVSVARAIAPKPFLLARSFSVSTRRTLQSPSKFTYGRIPAPTPRNSRTLSLGSIFGRSKPEETPSPHTVALVTRLEAEANVHPHDVGKQLALFEALLETKLTSSYELVVNRWERMVEFVSYSSVCASWSHSPCRHRILRPPCCTHQKPSKYISHLFLTSATVLQFPRLRRNEMNYWQHMELLLQQHKQANLR